MHPEARQTLAGDFGAARQARIQIDTAGCSRSGACSATGLGGCRDRSRDAVGRAVSSSFKCQILSPYYFAPLELIF
jgi:hypothetical protein